jgi:hypothetical protein
MFVLQQAMLQSQPAPQVLQDRTALTTPLIYWSMQSPALLRCFACRPQVIKRVWRSFIIRQPCFSLANVVKNAAAAAASHALDQKCKVRPTDAPSTVRWTR